MIEYNRGLMPNLGGVRIVESMAMVLNNFPESKHRPKRMHKKLLKRLGTTPRPDAMKVNGIIYAHPILARKIYEELKK